MYLGRTSLTQHSDQLTLGIAAHDGVIDDDDASSLNDVTQRVELEPNTQVAQGLRGLDESPAHVGVLDQAHAVGDAGLVGIADSSRGARLWHRDDEVGIGRVFLGQDLADFDANVVDTSSSNNGVRASQVNVFEDAPLGPGRSETAGAQPSRVNGDHLAGLDLANESTTDDVDSRSFGGDHPTTR